MRLSLCEPDYTERLASFFASLGQKATVDGPGGLTLDDSLDATELAIYLRVWHVLHPAAVVTVQGT